MKKRLINVALPYINNVPHLGNLVQVLSGDAFARYCRSQGYDTFYVCGTDEYGTATEIKALQLGMSPKALCDKFFEIHKNIYSWLSIQFDAFGRTTNKEHAPLVQDIFLSLAEKGFIFEKEIKQLYAPKAQLFLADRYVRGICPHCHYERARGDQCENCGRLLSASDLINPYSEQFPDEILEWRQTKHLFLDLPKITPLLKNWLTTVFPNWPSNAINMTESWLKKGLDARAITRDLHWGIKVPYKGFENKVFYVWFDAPIGYISITKNATTDWENWWKNENTELFQFIGKDNIPFHTIIFPSILLASGQKWTLVKTLSSSEYLNFENAKFSKSEGIGIFGDDLQKMNYPNEFWRFYIFFNRPEKSDSTFSFNLFQNQINNDLIGNFANFINRVLKLTYKNYPFQLPKVEKDEKLAAIIEEKEKIIIENFEKVALREALKSCFSLIAYANKEFQNREPWKIQDEKKLAFTLMNFVYLIYDLSIVFSPFLPISSKKIQNMLGLEEDFSFKNLRNCPKITQLQKPIPLFERIEDEEIEKWKKEFTGKQSQKEKIMEDSAKNYKDIFANKVQLRVAHVENVSDHENADKLYVLNLKVGDEERTIVSGLKDFYKKEELINKNILIAFNLKASKFRGVLSQGMLLAVSKMENDKELLEVIMVDENIPSGEFVELENHPSNPIETTIKASAFRDLPLEVIAHHIQLEGENLIFKTSREILKTQKLADGKIE